MSYFDMDDEDVINKIYYEDLNLALNVISEYDNSNASKVKAYSYLEKDIEEVMLKKLTSEEKNVALKKLKSLSKYDDNDILMLIEFEKKNCDILSYIDSYVLHVLIDKYDKDRVVSGEKKYEKRK